MDKNLPHYSRGELLGEGGMGKVYLALDNQLQRQVAIKQLTFQSNNSNENDALQEARLLARVNHTNIIQIYNVYDEVEQISLVMEYFKSKTLTQFQHETYLSVPQKVNLLRQLASGLAAAHKNDVIHCDLKPTNILVDNEGLLKIADFGIAQLANNHAKGFSFNTALNNVKEESPLAVGSLLYMSPEQIEQSQVDYKSDIFSFGIIAYQLIVGTHPFGNGSAKEVAVNICEKTPEPPQNLMLHLPQVLADLIMEMLKKSPNERQLTAHSIENRLNHISLALIQDEINEQVTMPAVAEVSTAPTQKSDNQETDNEGTNNNLEKSQQKSILFKITLSIWLKVIIFIVSIIAVWFYVDNQDKNRHVVILTPELSDSSTIVGMQKSLVLSAVEDALRQAVINTTSMYLISQREVKAISDEYPSNLVNLSNAVGASDIITTTLECDNSRCKVNFSRLTNNESNNRLAVKREKNWLVAIDKFNTIFSTSQMNFAALFPNLSDVNQSVLVQRAIEEADYREYIHLYKEMKSDEKFNESNIKRLELLLARTPYLYAGYSLYREAASHMFTYSQNNLYLDKLDILLRNTPPEYRYSYLEAIDRFWLESQRRDFKLARLMINEAKKRGTDDLTLLELEAFMLFSTGKYTDATNVYLEAYTLRPSSSLLYNIAISYRYAGSLNQALEVLEEILVLFPEHVKALQLRSSIWLLQGKIKAAIAAYEKLVNKFNNSTDFSNLSLAYALNKQYKKAQQYALKAFNENPENPSHLLNLADSEVLLNNEVSAMSYYRKTVEQVNSSTEVRSLTVLAQSYAHLKENNLAISALSQAQALAPNNGEVLYSSVIVYSLLNEKTSAIYYLEKALESKVGVVWFNLPWFDNLCTEDKFKQSMRRHGNPLRCRS